MVTLVDNAPKATNISLVALYHPSTKILVAECAAAYSTAENHV